MDTATRGDTRVEKLAARKTGREETKRRDERGEEEAGRLSARRDLVAL